MNQMCGLIFFLIISYLVLTNLFNSFRFSLEQSLLKQLTVCFLDYSEYQGHFLNVIFQCNEHHKQNSIHLHCIRRYI